MKNYHHKRAIIIGATSGIGLEVARRLHADGWTLGLAARREDKLRQIAEELDERVITMPIDVCADDAGERLNRFIQQEGRVELIFIASGIGHQNPDMAPAIELDTVRTNALGFTRIVTAAYNHFAQNGGGHIAVISSIAGTKGLGAAPAYSATKRYQNIYIQCLAQHATMHKTGVTFTDIRPGFVDTALLADGKRYPMLMRPDKVARTIIRAVYAKSRVVTIDWRYRVLVALWRMVPDWLWERLSIAN